MIIRPIESVAELESAVAIFRSLPHYFYDRDIKRVYADIKDWLNNRPAGVKYFAGFLEDQLVSCLGYRQDLGAHQVYHLSHFAVISSLRGQGIGSKMLGFVEDHLTQIGARVIVVWTSPLAYTQDTRAFYNAKGYQHTANIPDYWQDGDPLAFYIKKI